MWQRYLEQLEELGVVFVQSAGNSGYDRRKAPNSLICKTGMILPASLGTEDNNVITVASVNNYGRWTTWASPEGADNDFILGRETGHITTVRLSRPIPCLTKTYVSSAD